MQQTNMPSVILLGCSQALSLSFFCVWGGGRGDTELNYDTRNELRKQVKTINREINN